MIARMNYYIDVLKKYAVFNGRARRAEYWFFALFNIIIAIGLGILDAVIFGVATDGAATGLLGLVYNLAIFLPSIAVSIRRLHDTDRSGWWLLIALVPVIGAIVLLVFMVLEGTQGENRFGEDPKETLPDATVTA